MNDTTLIGTAIFGTGSHVLFANILLVARPKFCEVQIRDIHTANDQEANCRIRWDISDALPIIELMHAINTHATSTPVYARQEDSHETSH